MKKEDWWTFRLHFSHWINCHSVLAVVVIMAPMAIMTGLFFINKWFLIGYVFWSLLLLLAMIIRDSSSLLMKAFCSSNEDERVRNFISNRWLRHGENRFIYLIPKKYLFDSYEYDIKPNEYMKAVFGKEYKQFGFRELTNISPGGLNNIRLATKKEVEEYNLQVIRAKISLLR